MISQEPNDRHAQALTEATRPADWQNPVPSGRYNLVVIGAGPAGLICAAGAAGLGAKAALIEKYRLGGDCLHFGCVPSKALLRCARAAAEVRRAADFGVRTSVSSFDFPFVMERMRQIRAGLSHVDAAGRFARLGVDVYFGEARFVRPDAIVVGDAELSFSRAVVATGSTPADPGLPGLRPGSYLTNETVFNLTELPRQLVVLGAGPIGCELAQAFARLGSEMHLVNRSEKILSREEPEAAAIILDQLRRDGVHCHLGVKLIDGHERGLRFRKHGEEVSIAGDALLVATGRTPNVKSLNLAAAGIETTKRGVRVDDFLRTTNPRVFAAGDVCADQQFTHAADAMARIVVRNALFFGRSRWSRVVVPHCTYTAPELASIGLTAEAAAKRGIAVQTFQVPFAEVDRAVLDSETEGFARVHVRAGSDRIVGATIVGHHAGDLIAEVTLAMSRGIGLAALASIVRSYPTRATVLSKLADVYQRTRLTPWRSRVLRWFLQQRR